MSLYETHPRLWFAKCSVERVFYRNKFYIRQWLRDRVCQTKTKGEHKFILYKHMSGPDLWATLKCDYCKRPAVPRPEESHFVIPEDSAEYKEFLALEQAQMVNGKRPYNVSYGEYHYERPRTRIDSASTVSGSAHDHQAKRWLDDIVL